jgi:hypothetical protein
MLQSHRRRIIADTLGKSVRDLAATECPLMYRQRDAKGFSGIRCTRQFGMVTAANLLGGLDRAAIMSNKILAEIRVNAPARSLNDGKYTFAGFKFPIVQANLRDPAR